MAPSVPRGMAVVGSRSEEARLAPERMPCGGVGMGWDGMGWDGMGLDGMGWDGMGWDGMGWAHREAREEEGEAVGEVVVAPEVGPEVVRVVLALEAGGEDVPRRRPRPRAGGLGRRQVAGGEGGQGRRRREVEGWRGAVGRVGGDQVGRSEEGDVQREEGEDDDEEEDAAARRCGWRWRLSDGDGDDDAAAGCGGGLRRRPTLLPCYPATLLRRRAAAAHRPSFETILMPPATKRQRESMKMDPQRRTSKDENWKEPPLR